MGPLSRTLAEMRAEREAKRPPEATALMTRATDELRASGVLDRVVKVGERAPRFARPNLANETVRLGPLLSRGPVVLSFFRGRW
jgi:hypothetical protein